MTHQADSVVHTNLFAPKNFHKLLQWCCITTEWIRRTNLLGEINGLERLG
jgi:hypothetical protein